MESKRTSRWAGVLVLAMASACAAETNDGDGDGDGSGSTADAISFPFTLSCTGLTECSISPSGRARLYRQGARHQVDISGVGYGESDNTYLTAAAQTVGVASETSTWVVEEMSRRRLTASRVQLRGHSLGGIDAMAVVLHAGVPRATLFGVPAAALAGFSAQLRGRADSALAISVIDAERDPIAVGTRAIPLDERIKLRWVASPHPGGADMRNHSREAYCPVAPETCFR